MKKGPQSKQSKDAACAMGYATVSEAPGPQTHSRVVGHRRDTKAHLRPLCFALLDPLIGLLLQAIFLRMPSDDSEGRHMTGQGGTPAAAPYLLRPLLASALATSHCLALDSYAPPVRVISRTSTPVARKRTFVYGGKGAWLADRRLTPRAPCQLHSLRL